MRSLLFKSRLAVVAAFFVWPFIGIERIVGDHEMGIFWEPFFKHRPSLQFRFSNPAQKGLDIIPVDELSISERVEFKQYCEQRFGVAEPSDCYARLADRAI